MTVEEYSAAPNVESTPKRKHTRVTVEDANRWAHMYADRLSILKIAESENVAPSTVSNWLRNLGIEIKQGQHFVTQPPLKMNDSLLNMLLRGPNEARKEIGSRVWGIEASSTGTGQLIKFCDFVSLYKDGVGVKETARRIGAQRSTIANWREGRDEPYLVAALRHALDKGISREGCRLLPTNVSSGGNELSNWIEVPTSIYTFSDLVQVIDQTSFSSETYARASRFGLVDKLNELRIELFGYGLGMMVGDAGKLGGNQVRYRSMNIDLQLSRLEPSNEALGEFACLCFNVLGLSASRIKDKEPSGTQLSGRNPTPAYRWSSVRSPLIAWIFSVCMGLEWGQNTSVNPVHMEWIHSAPIAFRKRFAQAVADSDAHVKRSGVVITSVPNASFFARLLNGLGLGSAHTLKEDGVDLRTYVSSREAAALPLFNEFVKGYRYDKLMKKN